MAKENRYNTLLELITLARGGLSGILHSIHDVDFGSFGYVNLLCLNLICCECRKGAMISEQEVFGCDIKVVQMMR